MARNVRTMDGTEPDETGPRGPNLSLAQAAALRALAGLTKVEGRNLVGNFSAKVRERGVFVSLEGQITVFAAATVESLVARGFMEEGYELDGQRCFTRTTDGRSALEAGNIS